LGKQIALLVVIAALLASAVLESGTLPTGTPESHTAPLPARVVPQIIEGTVKQLSDGLSRITPTTSEPWSAIAKLYIYVDSDDLPDFQCSGFLVGRFHVITAGHCLHNDDYAADTNLWARRIRVVPGADSQQSPLGPRPLEPYDHAWAERMRSYREWIEARQPEHDWGLITLDVPLGDRAGWFALRTDDPGSSSYRGTLHTAGFPGELDGGLNLYHTSGRGCRADSFRHYFTMEVRPGQSGSPVWVEEGDQRYAVSIVTYSANPCNLGTRLDEGKFGALVRWVTEDGGGETPLAYVDLMDAGSSDFRPRTVIPGFSLLVISHAVRNNGTMPSGSFSISYHLLPVGGGQELTLGHRRVGSLSPGATITVVWFGLVPVDIPQGRYWVGWLLDSGREVSEINEGNNRVDIRAPDLSVLREGLIVVAAEVAMGMALPAGGLLFASIVAFALLKRRKASKSLGPLSRSEVLGTGDAGGPSAGLCPLCGTPAPSGGLFCRGCGTRLRP
jgi:V8-like Glu-specific endopeptidase